MHTIDLHGLNRAEAQRRIEEALQNAPDYGETVFRIIHGQGKHSGPAVSRFPVLKSWFRHWVSDSENPIFYAFQVYPGEVGSPYTAPNPGETVLVWRGAAQQQDAYQWEDDEAERETRNQAKGMRADRLRKLRRKKYR